MYFIGLVLLDWSPRTYQLNCIGLIILAGSSGSYRLDCIGWIVSVLVLGSLGENGFYALDVLLLDGWDGWTGWEVGGTGMGWRDRH